MRSTFMGLYTLTDDSEGHKAAQLALASPESYVMKPQREGGGNMLVGDEMCNALKTMSAEVTWPRILTPPHPFPPLSHARALSLSHVLSRSLVFEVACGHH